MLADISTKNRTNGTEILRERMYICPVSFYLCNMIGSLNLRCL